MIENRDVQKDLEQLDAILKDKGISRRDAMKMMGFSSLAAMAIAAPEAEAATVAKASDAKGKIVIIGGGLAGMSTAARLTNNLSNPDITVIEPDPKSVSYQPGQTFIASGIWTNDDISYNRDDYTPAGTKIVAEKAMNVEASTNTVTTESGKKIKYDVLIVAAGLKLDYGRIKGLEEAGEVYSTGDNSKLVKILDSVGANSLYTASGAADTWNKMQKFVADAKSGKKVKGVFTHPNTPIKCGGAPKKIMYLTNARLEEAGARDNADLHFYPNGGAMFGIKDYHTAIVKQFEARDMKWSYKHNLVEVQKGMAVFDKHWKEKGAYDADLEEYTMVTKHERVEVPFDFLHVTPPMKAPDEIGKSSVGSQKGFIPVKKETLQHVKYPNVFALGDIAAVPMGKTGGSARKQYAVLTDNVISFMESGSIPASNAKYDGYTVCPLITSIGTIMLAEFNWESKKLGSGKNAAAVSFLDPTQERYIWWLLKLYLLKPMTVYGMLAGKA
jgi:sulfide:quinone oxidoreductase